MVRKPLHDKTGADISKTKGFKAIQESWGIDEDTCLDIYAKLEWNLRQNEILGVRLQGFGVQHRLKEAIKNTSRQIKLSKILQDLPIDEKLLQDGLRRMAQNMNQNKRKKHRRMLDKRSHTIGGKMIKELEVASSGDLLASNLSSSITSGSDNINEIIPRLSGNYGQVASDFSAAVIVVRRRYGETRTCRPHDFYVPSNPDDPQKCDDSQIHINHLRFDKFVEVLTDELQFDKEEEMVFYEIKNGERIHVSTERGWRAALWDMHRNGGKDLVFGIDKSCVREKRSAKV